ncbi:MAG: hypothetical protein ACXVHX_33365 [Solirubrobacteraceae bacterium]
MRNPRRSQGLDAITSEIVDLVAAGVIDAATVTRSALQNAASIAKNISPLRRPSPRSLRTSPAGAAMARPTSAQ